MVHLLQGLLTNWTEIVAKLNNSEYIVNMVLRIKYFTDPAIQNKKREEMFKYRAEVF